MPLEHFGHEHTLELRAEVTILEEEEENQKVPIHTCYMCRKSISSWAYFCNQCDGICLHETCAKLPGEILHPMHSEHQLKFAPLAQFHRRCDACWQVFSGSSYNCRECNLHICFECALRVSTQQIIKHDFHKHPLTLVDTGHSSTCCACESRIYYPYSQSIDPYYKCTACSIWIHEKCASLPNIMRSEERDHDHPLTLAYQLPVEFQRYDFQCEVCHQVLTPSLWIYYCGPCRCFVHARCISFYTRGRNAIDYYHRAGDAGPNDVWLPCIDMFIEVIKPSLEKMVEGELKLVPEIKHFSHEHPLVLSTTPPMDKEIDAEEMLCHGCIQPILTPYYACLKCKYMLHLACANVPEKMYHLSHYGHLITLKKFRHELGYFCCSWCRSIGNGFFFSCEKCNLQIHLKCFTISARDSRFVYKLRKEHVLCFQGSESGLCNACRKGISSWTERYRCTCGFSLHPSCANLPREAKHRWDKHPLLLIYPPFTDHPDEFYCEVCEDEIHPKTWIYHCRECDRSFHPKCIPRLGKDRNMIFGGSIQFANHEHPLKSAREVRYRSSCSNCHRKLEGEMAWECEVCRFSFSFALCFACACHAKDPSYVLPKFLD